MKWWPRACKRGDMIRVRTGAVYHYGIFVSEDEVIQFGPPPIALAQTGSRDFHVMSTDIQTFSCGSIVEAASPETSQERRRFLPGKTVRLARSKLGQTGYDLVHNNCEHFVYECVYGVHHSTQTEDVRRRWLARPLLNVYVMPVSADLVPEMVSAPERNKELKESDGERKRLKFAAWKALERGFAHAYGLEPEKLHFRKQPSGKWVCEEYGISLTHTPSAVAAAISTGPVGVDLESLEDFETRFAAHSEGFCRRSFTQEELSDNPNPDAETFLQLWTGKESAFKFRGEGSFSPEKLPGRSPEIRTVRFDCNGHPMILSVCSPLADRLACYLVDNDSVCRLQTQYK